MKNSGTNSSRRAFFKKSLAVAAGVPFIGSYTESQKGTNGNKLPREIIAASLSLHGMRADTPENMVSQVLEALQNIEIQNPDIICLPETFPYTSNTEKSPPVSQVAEDISSPGPVLKAIASVAKEFSCYIVCPIYTKENGKVYNSAVLIDREGKCIGEYRKIHPAPGEIESGISPGPLDPPVFKTDFGIIGIQICFDIKWQEAWKKLSDKGAEIVFWPSAFSGGQMVNANAWRYQYYMISSSWKDTSKICDISGEPIAWTGRWDPRWVIAPINLEKVFLHAYPFYRQFDKLRRKYGNKIQIKTFHEEEWAILESRSADINIEDLMKEFDLVSQHDFLKQAEENSIKARKETWDYK